MDVGTQRVHNPILDEATSKLEEMIAEYIERKPLWTEWLPYVQCEHKIEPFVRRFVCVTQRKSLNFFSRKIPL